MRRMKLVAGLGNIGRKYDHTRHNVGFEVIAALAEKHASGAPKGRFQGETYDANVGGERVILLMPHTYMNLSGSSVQPAKDFFKVELAELLIVCDDFALPLGKLRFRTAGSAGGQKGLADVIRRLGTEEVPRLRLGVGPLPERWDPADFVLSKFGGEEKDAAKEMVERAAAAVADWATRGIEYCMNEYNA
jgi:PTH1 family peptidyl-tRNA hydrolase